MNCGVGGGYDRRQQRLIPFRLPPPRDIPEYRRTSRHLAGGISDGKHSKGYGNPLSVPAQAYSFVLGDGITFEHLLDHRLEASHTVRWHQHGDMLPHYIFGGVARERFGSPVPGENHPSGRVGDNCVFGTLHNRSEKLSLLLRGPPFSHVLL